MSSPIGLLKQEIKTIVIQGPNYMYFKLNFSKKSSLPSTHRSLLLQFHLYSWATIFADLDTGTYRHKMTVKVEENPVTEFL